jgi:hypothetical protein
MHDEEDERVVVLDAVHDHMFSHGQTAVPGAKVLLARTPNVRKTGEREESVRDGVNQAIGNVDATAFLCDV